MSRPGPRKRMGNSPRKPRRGRPLELLVAMLEGFLQVHPLRELDLEVVSPAFWPDEQTGEPREVDVSIGPRGAKPSECVMIECRDRGAAQDSMWIEQVEGKRRSLGPKRVIAVSRRGFTAPARTKAAAWGIELRSLAELTPEALGDWLSPGRLLDIVDHIFVVSDPQVFLHGEPADMVRLGAPSLTNTDLTLPFEQYCLLGADGLPVALADLPLQSPTMEKMLSWYADITPGAPPIQRSVELAPGPGQLQFQAGGQVLPIAVVGFTLTMWKVVGEAVLSSATAYSGPIAELAQTAEFHHAGETIPTTVTLTRATVPESDGTHRLQVLLRRPAGWRDEVRRLPLPGTQP